MASSFPHRSYFLAFNHICCLILADPLSSHLSATSVAVAVDGPSWTHLVLGFDEQSLLSVVWLLNSWGSLWPFQQLAKKMEMEKQFQRQKAIASKTQSSFQGMICDWTQESDKEKELGSVHIQTPIFSSLPLGNRLVDWALSSRHIRDQGPLFLAADIDKCIKEHRLNLGRKRLSSFKSTYCAFTM